MAIRNRIMAMGTRPGQLLILGLAVLALVLAGCQEPRRQSLSLPTEARVVSLSFVDADHGWLVAADCGQQPATPTNACRAILYATVDGGRSWSPGARILITPRKLQFTDRSSGWLIGSIGRDCGRSTCPNVVMRTVDGGRTWERASTTSVNLVDLSFTSPRDGWVLGEDCTAGAACRPVLLSTRSAGETWMNQDLPLTGRGFRIDRIDTATGLVGGIADGQAALLMTRDDGVHWERMSTPCRGVALALAFDSPDRGWLYCSTESNGRPDVGAVYRTADGGRVWKAAGLPAGNGAEPESNATEPAIAVPSSDSAWVLDARGAAHVTRDGGETWSRPPTPGAPLATIFFLDSTHGWAAGGQTVWRTVDAGSSWERISLAAR